jgi:hypothetical protein
MKSGTDPNMVGIYGCVDQNSIIKTSDGRTEFEFTMNLNNALTCEGGLEKDIFAENVDCKQDMSGENVMMKTYPYNKDDKYNWLSRKELRISSISLEGMSAKFVCHK